MTADICVVMNPGSGDRNGPATVHKLEELFARHPGRFALRTVRSGKHIGREAREAAREGFATVVAAGGDGTICAVTDALAGTDSDLGVLPLGTFNYFARSLGIPEDLEPAVETLVQGHTRPVDVGEVNGRAFLNNASLGAYAAILENREDVYRRWGRSRLAAYWSVLTTLATFQAPLSLQITVEGTVRRFRSPLVFVSNNAHQLDLLGLEGGDCIRSGNFALYVAPDGGRAALLRLALRLATHTITARRDFELICGSDIRVETARSTRLVARDGERERMPGPFRFQVRRGALRVVVPADATPP